MTARKALNSSVAWAFGFSVTILFIALWGRAVVVDTDTLGQSLAPLSGSSVVVDVVADWMADELVDSGYDPEVVDPAVGFVLDASVTADALDQFVVEVVDAAASPDPAGSAVDVASLLSPAVPELTMGLSGLGIPVDQGVVGSAISALDPMVIRQPGTASLVGPESPAAARLGTAALLATLGILVFGYFTVVSSEDRIVAVRGLFTRIAVGGFGFAILLVIGSWITDPRGGRAPVAETASLVARSKWMMPLQIGAVAAIVALSIFVVRRWLRRGEVSRSEAGQPTPPGERPLSRSGSR